MKCPRCQTHELIGVIDVTQPSVMMAACSGCSYYVSNSEAYAGSPSAYQDIGNEALTRTDCFGLTYSEVEGWLQYEPDFAKRIATPIPTKRRRRVTVARVTSSSRLLSFRFLL